MEKLNSSIEVDHRLAEVDVRSSIAYAKALEKAGILSKAEVEKIISGLEKVLIRELQSKLTRFRKGALGDGDCFVLNREH